MKLTFSRTKPAEAQFRRILESEPSGITRELFESAKEFIDERDREMRFQEPKLEFSARLVRIAERYPNALLVINNASRLGRNGQGLVDASEVADEYAAEEA